MIGSQIHWATDALLIIGGMLVFIAGFIVISACRLSSMISREEEARETRATFDRMNKAA